ncbi:MAG: hypothetical protein ACWA5U_03750 [bacterium]
MRHSHNSPIAHKPRYYSKKIIDEYKKLMCEALQTLKQRDATIAELRQQLHQQRQKHQEDNDIQLDLANDLEEQLNQERAAHNRLKSRYDKLKNKLTKNNHVALAFGKEREKYRGEITDLVLKALNSYMNSHIASLNKQSRKKHICMDLILANKVHDTREQCSQALKNLFKNYRRMTPKIRKELKSLGFEVVESHHHNHIRFIGDSRYQVTFAKTPSDYRVGNNIIRDIKSALL